MFVEVILTSVSMTRHQGFDDHSSLILEWLLDLNLLFSRNMFLNNVVATYWNDYGACFSVLVTTSNF